MSIEIEKIKTIKDDLDQMEDTDVIFVNEDGKARFVIMPIALYDAIEEIAAMASAYSVPEIKVNTSEDLELSYDEYERIRDQIMEIVEKTLMPKPEKLN